MSEQRKRLLIVCTVRPRLRCPMTLAIAFQSNRPHRLGITSCIVAGLQRIPHAVLTILPSFQIPSNTGGDCGRFVP